MFKNVNAIIQDSVGNIKYKGNIVNGTIAEDNGDGSYDVFISESTVAYPHIFTLSENPDLEVGDKVRILYKNGIKELPIILPPTITAVAVSYLFTCCRETNVISRHDGITETILETFSGPATAISGLCNDGTNLISCDDGYAKVYVHQGKTATVTRSFDTPGSFPSGLAFDGTNLISCDWGTRKIYIHTGISATITASFNSPGTFPRGLAVIGGNLISVDANSDLIYIHSGITASVSSSFASPMPQPNGLGAYGGNLLSCDNGTYGVADDYYFVHTGITSSVTTYNAPATYKRISGITYF